jgi:hypothetical protein
MVPSPNDQANGAPHDLYTHDVHRSLAFAQRRGARVDLSADPTIDC